ncbi:acyl-CoA dehydrogenase family protein [Streptomyces mobaraensis]|uniref:acyl-CoA dehydrogenase family protein n=1 Tax=Streptomyces mobaraensis TaxID=35621 RepID=UPI003326C505
MTAPAAEHVVLTERQALDAAVEAAKAAAEHAAATDRDAAFPAVGVAALREHGLLSAAIPKEYGGQGLDPLTLTRIGARLAGGCAATAMIWAMHQLQVACLARSAAASPAIAAALADIAGRQLLIASITSEVGVGGDMRRSVAAVEPAGDGTVRLTKKATTVSYGEHADGFLVTARSGPDAAPTDQVAVLVMAEHAELERTGDWNPLGMRGTCSPPFTLSAAVPAGMVLPEPFGETATRCMVPLSHLLWSGVWTGVAADAVRRAVAYSKIRMRAQLKAGRAADDPRLGRAYADLRVLQDTVRRFADDYAVWDAAQDADTTAMTVRANALKTGVSVDAVRVVEQALEICGMAGYSESGPYSVARHLRDLYSARLMIANGRLELANSELLLLTGDLIQE